jgi:hypothetical protein
MVFVVSLVGVALALPTEQGKTPIPLPAKIATAWKDAGAEVGWLAENDRGYWEFRPAKDGKPGDLPAFRFGEWKSGVIGKLPSPESAFGLYFVGTKVPGEGLKDLAGLKALEVLILYNTGVTDTKLKELANLKALKGLDLGGTPVTDKGLKELAGLTGLSNLVLNSTKITDAGLKELAGFKALHKLNLDSTSVTDQGLKYLAGLTALRELRVGKTAVTSDGIDKLKKSLPKLVVYSSCS